MGYPDNGLERMGPESERCEGACASGGAGSPAEVATGRCEVHCLAIVALLIVCFIGCASSPQMVANEHEGHNLHVHESLSDLRVSPDHREKVIISDATTLCAAAVELDDANRFRVLCISLDLQRQDKLLADQPEEFLLADIPVGEELYASFLWFVVRVPPRPNEEGDVGVTLKRKTEQTLTAKVVVRTEGKRLEQTEELERRHGETAVLVFDDQGAPRFVFVFFCLAD